MKRKDFVELKEKKISDLEKLVVAKKLEAKKAGLKIVSGKEKNLKLAYNLRREIAKIMTLIKEKKIIETLK